MPAIVTQNFKARQVDAFLTELDNVDNTAYLFIGNPYPWTDEENPPMPVDNDGASFNLWDRMYGLKQIPSTNYRKVIRRRNWETGVVFDYYSTAMGPLSETNFYVMTADFKVFKCLWNNAGQPSTVEPNLEDPAFTTADGYIWSYMYTIDTALAQTFLTPEYMPVVVVPSVQTAAATTEGAVTAVRVDTGGTNYLSVNFATANEIKPAVAYAVVDAGVITSIEVVDGGEYSATPAVTVTGGNGSNAELSATIDPITGAVSSVEVTDGGTGYTAPVVQVVSGSGTDFTAIPIAKNGAISQVYITDNGADYTYLSLAVNGGGSGATVTPILSPVLGHGFNAELELGATNIMFSTTFAPNDVEGYLPPSNRYRDVGIILNPGQQADPTTPFEGNIGTNLIKITQSEATALTFTLNETVTASNGAKAKVVYWDSTAGVLWVIQTIQENFLDFDSGSGNTLTGDVSTKTIEIGAVTPPDVAKYTGELQYIETREPIQRTASQFEEIKIVIEF